MLLVQLRPVGCVFVCARALPVIFVVCTCSLFLNESGSTDTLPFPCS